MSNELLASFVRSTAAEQIAQILYQTSDASALPWDCAPMTAREEYRARAREAVRGCLDFAVAAAREQMAQALATTDGLYWDDLGPTTRFRYRHRANAAWRRYRYHLAETAYPEAIERQMTSPAARGRSLGSLVDETRRQAAR